jgi:hypothetical protein
MVSNHRIKTKRTLLVISLLILILISACSHAPVPILSNSTCEPPCWNNIQPGETTKDEAVLILNGLPEVDRTTITLNGEPWDIFDDAIYFSFRDSNVVGRMYINKGKVSFVEVFNKDNNPLDITLGEAIARLGEPEYVINVPISGGPPLAPTTSYIITAIQPEKGSLGISGVPARYRGRSKGPLGLKLRPKWIGKRPRRDPR